MNTRESENYLAISRSSSASKSVEIFWVEIYWGQLFLGPNLVSFNRAVVPGYLSISHIERLQRPTTLYGRLGTYKVRNEIETKSTKTKRNEINEMKTK